MLDSDQTVRKNDVDLSSEWAMRMIFKDDKKKQVIHNFYPSPSLEIIQFMAIIIIFSFL